MTTRRGLPTTGGVTDAQRNRWHREEREAALARMVEHCQIVKHAMRSVGFRARVSPATKPPPYHIGDIVRAGVRVEFIDD